MGPGLSPQRGEFLTFAREKRGKSMGGNRRKSGSKEGRNRAAGERGEERLAIIEELIS